MEGNTKIRYRLLGASHRIRLSTHALKNGANKGVVLRQTFKRSELVPSPNRFGEAEWLLPREVKGADTAVVTHAKPVPEY